MSLIQAPAKPSSWTVRFKFEKKAYLLLVDPNQRLDEIRLQLINIMEATGTNPPSNNPDDLVFGRLHDAEDIAKGWLDINEPGNSTKFDTKGKGKATSIQGNSKSTPKSVGMQPDGFVAFRFKTAEEKALEAAGDELSGWNEDGSNRFNVEMPTIENTYDD